MIWSMQTLPKICNMFQKKSINWFATLKVEYNRQSNHKIEFCKPRELYNCMKKVHYNVQSHVICQKNEQKACYKIHGLKLSLSCLHLERILNKLLFYYFTR